MTRSRVYERLFIRHDKLEQKNTSGHQIVHSEIIKNEIAAPSIDKQISS